MSKGELSLADVKRHAELLANRVRKNHRRLKARFARENIEAYRLYDWDIPEVRATVDWYQGHLVVAEYEREQTRRGDDWLGTVGRAAAEALGISQADLHLKKRRTRPAKGIRYDRQGSSKARISVQERTLRFWVNLDDYIDTGLFLDHRDTREMVGKLCKGRSLLNLFSYTGSFSCYAARGGARRTLSVDQSSTYTDWASDNLKLNGFATGAEAPHQVERQDAGDALAALTSSRRRFDVVVLDPPSFSSALGGRSFSILEDHPALIRAALAVVARGGELLFSTNHQRFMPKLDGLRAEELSPGTVPIDYRNRKAHRLWRIKPGRSGA